MRKNLLAILIAISCSNLFAQETKKEAEVIKTKMESFASKTGTIVKFTDYQLSSIKSSYGEVSETRIRKINSGNLVSFFFQIEKQDKYRNSTASIEYSDLLEVIKAIKSLKSEVAQDSMSPNYLENKFTTVDGFQVGYFVNKGKVTWYLKLEKYGSDNTIFIDKDTSIEVLFEEARNKIDELKK